MSSLLTIEDIQRILKISKNTAYKLVKTNGFPSITIGKSIRIPEEEFEKWIKKYTYNEFKM